MGNVEIGVICTVVGMVLSFLAFRNNETKEVKDDGAKDGEIKTTLAYISKGVDDIRIDIKANERRVSELSERLTRVEEVSKITCKRLDALQDINEGFLIKKGDM